MPQIRWPCFKVYSILLPVWSYSCDKVSIHRERFKEHFALFSVCGCFLTKTVHLEDNGTMCVLHEMQKATISTWSNCKYLEFNMDEQVHTVFWNINFKILLMSFLFSWLHLGFFYLQIWLCLYLCLWFITKKIKNKLRINLQYA